MMYSMRDVTLSSVSPLCLSQKSSLLSRQLQDVALEGSGQALPIKRSVSMAAFVQRSTDRLPLSKMPEPKFIIRACLLPTGMVLLVVSSTLSRHRSPENAVLLTHGLMSVALL